ncbi:MAG: D-alanine--poly(phosphoribitol) ligase subunit 1 [Cyclobacteriaceae bacterium]|jgi:D-alanine--poly(phosphoribitol) ligase subunit 1
MEVDRIYELINNTSRKFSEDILIHEYFESAVEQAPNKIALEIGNNCITYKALNARSNALAKVLRKRNVGADTVVPVIVDRSFEMVIAVLAILKAGGAYLPISTFDPIERIRTVCNDCNASLVLTTVEDITLEQEVIQLIKTLSLLKDEENLPSVNKPNDLAYVIYTSGSTGKPKGVMIEHKSVINRLEWMQSQFPISGNDVLLQKTPICFDVSVWELFWWFFVQARLCLLKPNEEKFPRAIINTISTRAVSIIHFVPSMFGAFLEYLKMQQTELKPLRKVFCSGEALRASLVSDFNKYINTDNSRRLINLYGPTEATVDVSYYECTDRVYSSSNVPIGKPIQNTQLWLLNSTELIGVEDVGELCISGVGLARGYINQVELTHERFTSLDALDGMRVYKTGDLACIQCDGNIDFRGRIDNQVKIRGLRIELGEIEAIMLMYPGVSDSVVITKQYSDSVIIIVGYFVAVKLIDVTELKKFIQSRLPSYMVPNRLIELDEILLTANGKKDRRKMSELELVKS